MAAVKKTGMGNADLGIRLESQSHPDLTPASPFDMIVEDGRGPQSELKGDVHYCLQFSIVLAGAADVKLGAVQSIDYSWGEIEFEYSPMRPVMADCCTAPMAKSYNLDIEPDDIEVSDTVTVVWEIA